MNTITTPIDFKDQSIDAIVSYFDTIYRMSNLNYDYTRANFYCGITNNIEYNLSRHGIEGYTACVECSSFEISSQVEERLGNMGFDIGGPNNPAGNGGADDSTIVYMAFMDADFKR